MEKIIFFLKQFGLIILMGLIGCLFLIYGLFDQVKPEPAIVEIVKGASVESKEEEILVDVSGAIANPGLYKLPNRSRIGDALVRSGGLSASADREWVAKNINLAEVLKDGSKIYVPHINDGKDANVAKKSSGQININTASLEELDKLNGIGLVRAQVIIDNRPYSSINDLTSKAKIPESVVEKIKDQITLY